MKFFLLFVGLVGYFTNTIAQTKQEKISENLIGIWKFQDFSTPTGKETYPKNSDACIPTILYEFRSDGSAVMKSDDTTKCNTHFPPNILWKVITLHDSNGKEHFGVRIMEDDAPADRESYDRNTYTDMIFLLVKIKKNTLRWIHKPQYTSPSIKDWQSIYNKISENK